MKALSYSCTVLLLIKILVLKKVYTTQEDTLVLNSPNKRSFEEQLEDKQYIRSNVSESES